MYSRLFAAVLRLLPGSVNQCPDNPLQVDRLPDCSGVELDYPVFQEQPPAAQRRTVMLISIAALASSLIGWASQIIPFSFITGGLNTVVLLVAASLILLGLLARRWPILAYISVVAMLLVLSTLVRVVPYSACALALALLAIPFFADSLVANFLFLKTAAPIPRGRSLQLRGLWKKRWSRFRQTLMGSEYYALNYLVLLPASWLLLREVASMGGVRACTVAFLQIGVLGCLWSVATEVAAALVQRRRPLLWKRQAIATWRAIVEWTNYNRLSIRGAGVHQSPAGPCLVRRWLLIGMILAWACLWSGLERGETSFTIKDYFSSPEKFYELVGQNVNERLSKTKNPPEVIQKAFEKLPQYKQNEWRSERLSVKEVLLMQEGLLTDPTPPPTPITANTRVKRLIVDFIHALFVVSVDVLLPVLATLIAIGGIVLGVAGRSLAGIEATLGFGWRKRVLSTDNWELIVDRISSSDDATERNSLFMGTNARDDSPVIVHRDTFREHAHILGDSGAGKTSMGVMPLVTQLMRSGDCSVVVIDLKADDQVLFECLREESSRLTARLQREKGDHGSYPFRWFTTVIGRSSYAFNPLTQRVMNCVSSDQRTDLLQAALGLNYGNDYGRKFFGDANYDILNYALSQNPNIDSFAALDQILAGADRFPLHKESKKAASNVRSSVRRLARIRALNASRSNGTSEAVLGNAIELSDVFTRPQAIYVALPPTAGISSTADIARIFLYSLLSSAQNHPRPRKQVYLIVDEFQRIIAKNLELFLQQARSMDIGCILANQSLSDLESVDADLVDAVRTNTRFRQVFGAGSRSDISDLIETGGETVFGMRSWGYEPTLFGPAASSFNVSESRSPRLSVNDILLATDAPGRNIACVRRGHGFAQFGGMPFVMDSVFHLKRPKPYDDYLNSEWPPANERLVVATLADGKETYPEGGAEVLESEPPPDAEQTSEQKPTEAESSPLEIDDTMLNLYVQQELEREELRKKLKNAQRRKKGP